MKRKCNPYRPGCGRARYRGHLYTRRSFSKAFGKRRARVFFGKRKKCARRNPKHRGWRHRRAVMGRGKQQHYWTVAEKKMFRRFGRARGEEKTRMWKTNPRSTSEKFKRARKHYYSWIQQLKECRRKQKTLLGKIHGHQKKIFAGFDF